MLAPLTVGQLEAATARWRQSLADQSAGGTPSRRSEIRELVVLLSRATVPQPAPTDVLTPAMVAMIEALPSDVVDSLAPKPRTAVRLVRAGCLDAAWAALCEAAIGVVADPFRAATATGAGRATGRRPLRALLEPPAVYARLPGFRDPRFAAPDSCYEIADTVKLRHEVDEVAVIDGRLMLAGWAALDIVDASPDETVRLVLRSEDGEVAVAGRRLRRPDLVTGRDEGLRRRAWSGWSVGVDVDRLGKGEWRVSLELDHSGLLRRGPVGSAAGDLALAGTQGVKPVGDHAVRWDTSGRAWRLIVAAQR
jgi:hypothetical protein